MKYDKYNIDIVIETNKGKYLIEVDGVFFHGLINLEEHHKYFKLMQERK